MAFFAGLFRSSVLKKTQITDYTCRTFNFLQVCGFTIRSLSRLSHWLTGQPLEIERSFGYSKFQLVTCYYIVGLLLGETKKMIKLVSYENYFSLIIFYYNQLISSSQMGPRPCNYNITILNGIVGTYYDYHRRSLGKLSNIRFPLIKNKDHQPINLRSW